MKYQNSKHLQKTPWTEKISREIQNRVQTGGTPKTSLHHEKNLLFTPQIFRHWKTKL